MQAALTNRQKALTSALLVSGTVLGLAGTDLVLPSVPTLPDHLHGTLEQAQLVLATFAAGSGVGLLFFGEMGARFDQRRLLVASLLSFALLSLSATWVESINALVAVRFLQGFAGSAAAVFAPGMIRKMYGESGSLRVLGVLGSIESMVPALAPVLGAWLLVYFDWTGSFLLIAVFAATLGVVWLGFPRLLPNAQATRSKAGYRTLLTNGVFQRYALSQALSLGGLLVFVFGAPTVLTVALGGSLADFIIMQVIGITLFVITANLTSQIVAKLGAERVILLGTVIVALGFSAIFAYALFWNGARPQVLWVLFAVANLGLGLRGPPGFYAAIVASGDNDARGAALVLLYVLLIAALGTAAVAPFIETGLLPLSLAASLLSWLGVLLVRHPQTLRSA